MKRRQFVTSALSASIAVPLRGAADTAKPATSSGEFYELRRYQLTSGPGGKITHSYLADALLPALGRLGINRVGVFDLYIGEGTPAIYTLIPSTSLDTLVTLESRLTTDDEYRKAGKSFLEANGKEPPFQRFESSLLSAFAGFSKLTVPPVTAKHGSRVFQLRTYESPTVHDHQVKVEMFNSGEFGVFERAGFWQVFYGDTLVGPRLPNLTYMLAFPDLGELTARWKAFGADAEWKKLIASPKFNYEDIVSNVTSLILNPTSYSQI